MNAAPVRPAATVVLLRDTAKGLETLMLRRHSKLAFAGGAWVFPGGAVEAGDESLDSAAAGAESRTHSSAETTEEVREEGVARRAAVRETMEECGLRVGPEQLVAFAHWTTPPESPKRYATWFFAACIDCDGESVRVDGGEIDHHSWYRPAAALADHRAGLIELMPPTLITLTELAAVRTGAEALSHWRAQPLLRIEPRVSMLNDTLCMLYPGDAGYETVDPQAEGARHRCLMAADGWHYQRNG